MDVINATYLPFTVDQLRAHFAPVGGRAADPDRYVKYYLKSVARFDAYTKQKPAGKPAEIARVKRWALQMQKDERFWIAAALMKIFHAPERDALLVKLLTRALGDVPPFKGCATWAEALGADLRLYFEVNLPSPPAYKKWLSEHLPQRSLIPHTLERALAGGITSLEGTTKADAMLIAPDTGFAVVFEAKVLSDASSHILHDGTRNQIARNLDVLMDENPQLLGGLAERDPRRSCFVMVTPELFREEPESRLYGWLMNGYREDTRLLKKHLPHRDIHDLNQVSRRLGWLTWEDCSRVLPDACPWLPRQR